MQIRTISFHLQQRLQFLQSLLLLSSFHQILTPDFHSLQDKHFCLQKLQIESIKAVIGSTRIDQPFKKAFQKMSQQCFCRIYECWNCSKVEGRKCLSGRLKQIIGEYIQFFKRIKEKQILDFLSEVFDLTVYNQTTVLYVLTETLFKYLRIKCDHLIRSRISKRINQKNKIGQKKIHNIHNAHKQRTTRSGPSEEEEEHLQYMNKTLTIKDTKRESIRNRIVSSEKGKRRVIKSYKTLEKQKIDSKQRKSVKQQMNWMNSMKGNFVANQDTQLKLFRLVYLRQWNEYLSLVGIDHEELKEEIWFTGKKKKEWLIKNHDKVIVQMCIRNDYIRNQMEAYSEKYHQ